MQFEIEFNDDDQPAENFIVSINDLKKASFVLLSEEIDVEQSLMMDCIIQPLRNLIEEKKILPGTYQVYGLSSVNRTILFNVSLKSFNDESSIKSQVIVSYFNINKPSSNESRHTLIGKIRVLSINRSYTYEIYTIKRIEVF